MRKTSLLCCALLLASSAFADTVKIPTPVIRGASIATQGRDLLFELLFDHAPDFRTLDQYQRPAESFQWYLTEDLKASRPMNSYVADYIVRGDSMGAQGRVEVCGARPFGAGCPGGWGVDLGPVLTAWDPESFVLSFSVPSSLFDGSAYAFDVISLKYGAQFDGFYGTVDGGDAVRWGPSCPWNAPINCYEVPKPVTLGAGGVGAFNIPEASSLGLLPFGMAGLWILRRRVARNANRTRLPI